MTTRMIEVDYGTDVSSHAMEGNRKRLRVVTAANDAVVLVPEKGLGGIPAKSARDQIPYWQFPLGKEVEYTAGLFPVSAEKAVVFDNWILTQSMSSLGKDTTVLQTRSHQTIRSKIERMFAAGSAEVFEDGMENDFSRALISVVKEYSNDAIAAVANLILGERIDPAVASEALRWIGYMEDPENHASRLSLLMRSLECSSAWVRDGASLGLSYLDDPAAIPALKEAIAREQYDLLRRNMALTIEDLRERDD